LRPKLAWTLADTEVYEEDDEAQKPSPYDDLWSLDEKRKTPSNRKKRRKFPPQPEKDLLLFIEEYSRELDEWQRDILTMMREEMLYFWPQL
ncbi:SpoVR family protein, partial [Salmonella enterica subsp. enterica serovar 1,4,[5],12:i:-]